LNWILACGGIYDISTKIVHPNNIYIMYAGIRKKNKIFAETEERI
jgi:hypothetical protein